jgi:tripartite-type tricarboxylate transporter receptor subunit TctC
MALLGWRDLRRAAATAALLAAVSTLSWGAPAFAETYPARPIRIIVSNAPGASTDVVARLVARAMTSRLGVSVFVENRAGASGVIGTETAAHAAQDGYTLLFGLQDTLTLLPILKKSLPYDAERDFAPIAKVGDIYLLYACNSKVPVRSLAEFVELAKARPNELKFSSGGIGGINQLATELLIQKAGISLVHVPYNGGAAATLALMSGEVDLFSGSAALLAEGVKSGQIRGLAVAKETRSDLLPDVPTTREVGIDDLIVSAYFGLFAPKAVPADIIALLSRTIVDGTSTPEFRQLLAATGGEGTPLGSEAFDKSWKNESVRWRQVIERAGLSIDDF